MSTTLTLSAVVFALTIAVRFQFLNAAARPSEACVQQPKDLFLVVDGSASIGPSNFKVVRHFLRELVSAVHIGQEMTHVGLLQFSNKQNVKTEFGLDFSYDTDIVKRNIEKLSYQSGDATMTDMALRMVADEVFTGYGSDRVDVENVLIIFTDGNANSKSKTLHNAEVLKQRGVRIIVIGAGDDHYGFKSELEKIASHPDDVKIVQFSGLRNIVVDIVDEVCKVITPPPPPTTAAPPTTTLPPTTLPPTTTQSPTTTPAPTTPTPVIATTCSDNPKDILFVVDGTSNHQETAHRTKKHFSKILKFVKRIVSKLSDKFTVGVLQYSEKGKVKMDVEFSFGASIGKLNSLINNIKQQKGRERYTGEALVKANNKFYELNALRNQQYPKVIVHITRGEPWDRRITASESRMLQLRGIRLITIGVGVRTQQLDTSMYTYLNAIASRDDALFYKYSKLRKGSEDVVRKLCEVKGFRRQPADVREGAQCHRKPHDIVFVVDGSASIKYTNFEKMRTFIMDFISLLRLESSDINTGFVQFSETRKTRHIWKLSKISEDTALRFVKYMPYQAGKKTMTGYALGLINQTFNGHGGDRPNIKNTLIIFTDGGAHDSPVVRKMATYLKGKGVTVVAIGVGTKASLREFKEELNEMASSPQHVLTVSFNDLDVFAEKAFPVVCGHLSDLSQ